MLSVFIRIVTIALVAVAGAVSVYALFVLGYSVSYNVTDAQGSLWGALASTVAALSIPAAAVIAFRVARRHGLRGWLFAMVVAGVISATVSGLYLLYLFLFVVFGS